MMKALVLLTVIAGTASAAVGVTRQLQDTCCDDDRLARFFVAETGKTEPCVWLADRLDDFGSYCEPSHPSRALAICRETCGQCTDEIEDTDGFFEYRGIMRPCLWLSLRNYAIDEACTPGSEASSVCPETCQTCEPEVLNFFQRISSFLVCSQIDDTCDDDTETVAEIVAVTDDGMTLVYSDAETRQVGLVDISDPMNPKAGGTIPLGGEPTSVAVRGAFALVGVNDSADFINTAGRLLVIDIASSAVVATIDLGGQPDSVTVSPDGTFAAIAIENERDEDLGDGVPPQTPAGFLVVVDTSSNDPTTWSASPIDFTGLSGIRFPDDPEPEFVSINSNNVAVVTLQENNGLVLVDLPSLMVTLSFSAGSVTLTQVDLTEESVILQEETQTAVPREPDGVVWIDTRYFVTADEGDLDGGSRGFTIFDSEKGIIAYNSGNTLDHMAARYGHYPEERSGNKGNEPENVAFGIYGGKELLFVNSERSALAFVYDVSDRTRPIFLQVLPTGVGPEGGLAIPSRDLYVVACEVDERDAKIRSSLVLYQRGFEEPAYPHIQSLTRDNGTPIPWGAISGLAAETRDASKVIYAVEDSFYLKSRMFVIDISASPAILTSEFRIMDSNGVFAGAPFGADRVNDDMTVNVDLEGIAVSAQGGFWLASEGSGTVGDESRPVTSLNYLFKVSATGVIEEVVTLPDEVNAIQLRFGFEGVAEGSGDWANKVVVAFQRAWGGEAAPRLGVYDSATKEWSFYFYPLDPVESQNGGWVGLSDIAPIDGGKFLVLERDNQGGPDGVIKRIYSIDLSSESPMTSVTKRLVRDLVPGILASGGLLFEKIEGLALDKSLNMWIASDNDGVDDNSGETLFENVGTYVPAPKCGFWLQVLHSSDNESSFQDPNTLEEKVSFYAALANGLAALQSNGEDTFTIHLTAGDHTIPGPFYQASAEVRAYGAPGIADILIYNAMGLTGNGMGNHEFDGGIGKLLKGSSCMVFPLVFQFLTHSLFTDEFAHMLAAADYPFIAVNLDFSKVVLAPSSPAITIGPDAGPCSAVAGHVTKSCWVPLKEGIQVGLIGRAPAGFFNVIEDPETNIPGLDFVGGKDEDNQPIVSGVGQVLEQVTLLKAAGAELIILLDHAQDFTGDPLSADLLSGIDIIVAAGSTGFMAGETNGPFNLLREGETGNANYPTVRADSQGKNILVVNSDQLYAYIGFLRVYVEDNCSIGMVDARSGPIATTAEAVALLQETESVAAEPNAVVDHVLDNLQSTPSISESFGVVGTTEAPLVGERADVRGRETNLGRLAADSTLWGGNVYTAANGLPAVDIALKNGGGIRDTIEGPEIIRLTIRAALAFDNKLSIVELTAVQLLAAMENAVSRVPAADGRFPQIAGISLTYDPTKEGVQGLEALDTPSRIQTCVISKADGTNDVLVANFMFVGDPSRTFIVATNSFLLTGGDGYVSLSAGNAIGETPIGEQQILEDYIVGELGGTVSIMDPPPSPRVSTV